MYGLISADLGISRIPQGTKGWLMGFSGIVLGIYIINDLIDINLKKNMPLICLFLGFFYYNEYDHLNSLAPGRSGSKVMYCGKCNITD